MQHPLEFVSTEYRKRLFFAFLIPTLILLIIFEILDQPLKTPASPNGILSFELAHTSEKAFQILVSWESIPNPGMPIKRERLFAAFDLGIDYLFMPLYAFALAFGTLLAANRHGGGFKSLGAVAGYGAFVAAGLDAVENYALFQILLNRMQSPYPEIAFYCASIKFALLIFGILYGTVSGLWPKTK